MSCRFVPIHLSQTIHGLADEHGCASTQRAGMVGAEPEHVSEPDDECRQEMNSSQLSSRMPSSAYEMRVDWSSDRNSSHTLNSYGVFCLEKIKKLKKGGI